MQQTSNTRNVARLAVAQAPSMTTMNVNIINTPLVGSLLDPVAWLSSIWLSLQFVASMWQLCPRLCWWIVLGGDRSLLGGSDCRFCHISSSCCNHDRSFCPILCLVYGTWHRAWICQFLSLWGKWLRHWTSTAKGNILCFSGRADGGVFWLGNRSQYGSVGASLSLCRLLFFWHLRCSLFHCWHLLGWKFQNPTVPVQVDGLRVIFPQPGVFCGYGLLGYWICINELFDDSNAIAVSECCPAWHIGQCHDHPMAFCGDVRSVIFYWEFDPTIRHKQNSFSWPSGLHRRDEHCVGRWSTFALFRGFVSGGTRVEFPL